jgi:hypothetical protein
MAHIRRFNENDNTETMGIRTRYGRKSHTNPDRKEQHFTDYYTGARITGLSKFEIKQKIMQMAQGKDDLAILAQFCLQIERDSMQHDYDIEDSINKPVQLPPVEPPVS